MAFQYLTNLPLDHAQADYRACLLAAGFAPRPERIPAQAACGRVTAAPVYARICAPHYPACAMDGVALDAKVSFGATETTPVCLPAGAFFPVDTGDPLPSGCDAVVMIEEADLRPDGSLRLYAPAAPWQHVRQVGEDICAGEMILPSHTSVSPAAVGALLAGGVAELEVLARPVVGILPTGDEIVPPCSDPGPGDILEFNSAIFSSMLEQWGAVPRIFPIVPDDLEKICTAAEAALQDCDILLLGAGSSAGREDFSAQAISRLGSLFCHGLAIRPGKPAILANRGPKPILGVPGYPVSGILVLEKLLKPLLDDWFFRCTPPQPHHEARLVRPVVSSLKYREFVRVRLGKVGGTLTASPLSRGSGVISSFVKADGILEVPQGSEGYEAGSMVQVRLLRPMEELENSLVAIGSHDPLLDELADLLHLADPALYMRSAHVGSMGGIMAVRRGETHMAGIHLLDEKDGSYNESFVEKYFPQGGVRLVECVGRSQGLMLQKGNPLGIRGIPDLARSGLRYINRQKGSGTRILIDYLCRQAGLDTAAVSGYGREAFTHTAVAAQIAAGTADAGMGIFSAAKLYDLDFLPICTEQYDLLIPDSAWDSPMVRRLLSILAGAEFRRRLQAMGGYRLDRPGHVRRRF